MSNAPVKLKKYLDKEGKTILLVAEISVPHNGGCSHRHPAFAPFTVQIAKAAELDTIGDDLVTEAVNMLMAVNHSPTTFEVNAWVDRPKKFRTTLPAITAQGLSAVLTVPAGPTGLGLPPEFQELIKRFNGAVVV